jgi:mannosyl-3-phosphoglycerate phosphatase
MGILFMTDLDGTLLDHDDFSFASIKSDIHDLIDNGITLVPNSSKTSGEIERFCDDLGTDLPYICENGAAMMNRHLIDLPQISKVDHIVGLAPAQLMSLWERHVDVTLRRHCHFLAELGEAEQALHLGLRGDALNRAMARGYSAPFVFTGSEADYSLLVRQATDAGLAVRRGGRVCNLSAGHDKASFNRALRCDYIAASRDLVIVGFGDGDNDIAMLEDADIACVVPRPGTPPLTLATPPSNVIVADRAAPEGWLDAAWQALSIAGYEREEHHG